MKVLFLLLAFGLTVIFSCAHASAQDCLAGPHNEIKGDVSNWYTSNRCPYAVFGKGTEFDRSTKKYSLRSAAFSACHDDLIQTLSSIEIVWEEMSFTPVDGRCDGDKVVLADKPAPVIPPTPQPVDPLDAQLDQALNSASSDAIDSASRYAVDLAQQQQTNHQDYLDAVAQFVQQEAELEARQQAAKDAAERARIAEQLAKKRAEDQAVFQAARRRQHQEELTRLLLQITSGLIQVLGSYNSTGDTSNGGGWDCGPGPGSCAAY